MYTNFAVIFFIIRFNRRPPLESPETNMTTNIENDERQLNIAWQHKISGTDIELKEMQFMHEEAEYYKLLKTKSKKNAHAEDKTTRFFSVEM